MMTHIFIYWRNKRRNLGSSLVRQFWPKTELGPFKHRQQMINVGLRNRAIKMDSI